MRKDIDEYKKNEPGGANKRTANGVCKICGKPTSAPIIMCCEECKKAKKEELKTTLRKIGAIVACAGSVLYVILQIIKGDDNQLGKMTDEELKNAREKVRQSYIKKADYGNANQLYWLLDKFDKEMNKRAWGERNPAPPSYHSEHGFYLSEE